MLSIGVDTYGGAGNGKVDWSHIQTLYRFAILRCGIGYRTDKEFTVKWPQLRATGLVRHAYFFWRVADDPTKQAETLFRSLPRLEPGDFLWLDLEFPGEGGLKARGFQPDAAIERFAQLSDTATTYYGFRPGIYTSARVVLDDLANRPVGALTEAPLWLAEYTHQLPPPAPPVPPQWAGEDPKDRPFSKRRPTHYSSKNWWIHQYRGDVYGAPGFPHGNIDLNVFNLMRIGEVGERVRWAQRRLGVAQTGRFDAATKTAAETFQRRVGLHADGVIGPKTFGYMARA